MIICSCHALSDHEVRDTVEAALSRPTMSQVYSSLGRKPQCGRCVRTIRRIVTEAQHEPT
jgi:bacterioferritin-associated ferredoxin